MTVKRKYGAMSVLFCLIKRANKCKVWTLVGALPVGWKVDALQASSEAIALEELTLVYEGLNIEGGKKVQGPGNLEQIAGRVSTGYFTGSS